MKKKTLIERKKVLKEAYYNELKKKGIINTPKVKTLDEMTKKELIELALGNGLELDSKLTKAVMIEMINSSIENWNVIEEEDRNFHVRPQVDGKIIDTPIESVENYKETKEELLADGTIEDINIPNITEEQVQAVANAIVEQAEDDNKSIDQVVNEIVEESVDVS